MGPLKARDPRPLLIGLKIHRLHVVHFQPFFAKSTLFERCLIYLFFYSATEVLHWFAEMTAMCGNFLALSAGL